MNACEIKSHHYYFPRLLFAGRRTNRLLLFEEVEGSILLYSLQQRASRLELGLYVPPFPLTDAALTQARRRMRDFNRGRPGRVEWVQQKDAAAVRDHGFSLRPREEEFIYDRARVVALEGSDFAKIRRNLAALKKYDGLVIREFNAADAEPCTALYLRFQSQLQARGVEPKGYRGVVNCLKGATRLPVSRLRGEVFEIDGTIRAVSFGGPINATYGCVYLTFADRDYPGLAYALRYHMMKNFPELTYFTDSTDNGREGLAEMKRRFRPVEMHGVLTAREER